MYKNDASPGAKRASLWDRMDHVPGLRSFLSLQGVVQLLRLNTEIPLCLGSWIKPCGTFDKTVTLGAGPNSIWEAVFPIYFSVAPYNSILI